MRLTRDFSRLVILGTMMLAACGGGGKGGDDGDVDAGGVDSGPTPDAPPTTQPSMGLGKTCDQANPCPTQDPPFLCATVGTVGFCTKICGNTAAGATTPPADGNTKCMAIQPASPSGTPLCALTAPPMNNTMDWACALGCGVFMNQNLGDCPTGLTCTSNICQ